MAIRLDSLHHLFHTLIIPIFTYGISVWGVASYDKYLFKIDKFQKRTVRIGFLKEFSPVLSLLEALDHKLWKTITTFTEGPLVDLLPIFQNKIAKESWSFLCTSSD